MENTAEATLDRGKPNGLDRIIPYIPSLGLISLMPVQPFQANTFVAFIDIAGFKLMMGDGQRVPLALDAFYNAGFLVLRDHQNESVPVDGFFISDCGVLFVRGEEQAASIRLESLCQVLRQIHQRTFERAVQLITSIAWGGFSYDERIEFPGIEKNPIYGNAYVAAFADNQGVSSKLYPSECRLRRDGLPEDVLDFCTRRHGPVAERMRETSRHFYYEWMRP